MPTALCPLIFYVKPLNKLQKYQIYTQLVKTMPDGWLEQSSERTVCHCWIR
ncbi:hypothetical protein AM1_3423 [Acaryochloris marina MBIC11017]|uniref:Uncharacterized protein n=1 Tax=Acaryochloris marina (strain MBIC 11017) TaxID=329726 RepID=B0C070_ACAM1|nr:hypothetical protein AM1_3423 [Acaryochloris marina MBIC11017]